MQCLDGPAANSRIREGDFPSCNAWCCPTKKSISSSKFRYPKAKSYRAGIEYISLPFVISGLVSTGEGLEPNPDPPLEDDDGFLRPFRDDVTMHRGKPQPWFDLDSQKLFSKWYMERNKSNRFILILLWSVVTIDLYSSSDAYDVWCVFWWIACRQTDTNWFIGPVSRRLTYARISKFWTAWKRFAHVLKCYACGFSSIEWINKRQSTDSNNMLRSSRDSRM